MTRRKAAAFALSLVLTALGVLGVVLAVALDERHDQPGALSLPWPVLIPLYVLATHLNLSFQRRDSSVGVTLAQLPLALGVVLVEPAWHLCARLVAAVMIYGYRRHGPLKLSVNIGLAAMEVGVAALAVSAVPGAADDLGPVLWGALLLGLLTGELLSFASMTGLFVLLGMPVTRRDVVQPLVLLVLTSAVFTGLAIVALSAYNDEHWTLPVMCGLAGGLGLAYRAHRRLQSQQEATEQLYTFVKDLGPVDVEDAEALRVLEVARELLHAEHLELACAPSLGAQGRVLTVHLHQPPEVRLGQASPPQANGHRGDRMTTPLFSSAQVIGLLSARDRIGSERDFDQRDQRLLETVATELATALDRGRMLRELALAARTDSLTNLPNLHQVTRELDAMLGRGQHVVVVAVAVDSFREVNDTLGHEVGDALLREVANRLCRASPQAVVGRIGGGRFAVALDADLVGGDASLFGLDILTGVEGDAQLGAISTHVRASVGCTRSPDHGRNGATLIRRAETAMSSARQTHAGPVLWQAGYEVQAQRHLALVMALREAVTVGAVGVAYQPKISAVSGRVSGVEALARWNHIALGEIVPDEFVPLAETSGLMAPLTRAVLQQAVAACRGWQRLDPAVGVSVNISAGSLEDAGFVGEVGDLLWSSGLPAGLLTLELTEGVLVADPHLAGQRMAQLQRLGVRLSIDDFGTGYSSLTYLKSLPVDEVKIDKAFVSGLVEDRSDQAVVRAVVDIAHTLGVSVVAEGVENKDQRALLSFLGVDELQGYLHSGPMSAPDVAAWIHTHNARTSSVRAVPGSDPGTKR